MNKLSSVCVYCASSGKVPDVYLEAARTLGALLAQQGITLINGGGRTGLMGAASDACLEAGGKVIGVIPRFMIDNGWGHDHLSELIVTADMHERKQTMARMADASMALPGGCGTLEELLEVITWKQIGIYSKPIVMINTAGFFDPLLVFFERAIRESFMRSMHQSLWQVVSTPAEGLRAASEAPVWDPAYGKFAAI